MAKYSISSYTADGTTTDFLLTWDYLDKTHITVYVDGVNVADAGSGFTSTLINSTTVRVTTDLGAAVPAGKIVELRRETPIDTQAVTFNDGSSLNGGDLNTNTDYLLFAMQESIDTIDIAAQEGAAVASAAAAASALAAEGFKDGAETAETNAAAFANAAATYRDEAQTAKTQAEAAAASLNIDQNVSTTGTPSFSSVTAGQVNSSGAVIATGAGSFGDDVDVTGDLGVTGTVTAAAFSGDGSGLTGIPKSLSDLSVTATSTELNKLDGFVGTTGNLNATQFLSGRNRVINGNFDIWQRGTSFSGTGYGSDRWRTLTTGSTAATSRQAFTLGQTDVPNEPSYFHRVVATSSAGAANYVVLQQRIEDVRSLAGQTVTLSFWAKADASKNIAVEFSQDFGSGGSSVVLAIDVTTCALTTSWQKFTITASISSISGATIGSQSSLDLTFWFDAGSDHNSRSNSLGQQSGTFDIAQVQLEAGDVATPFEVRHIGQELALCQRYYQKSYNVDTNPATVTSTGSITYTTTTIGSGGNQKTTAFKVGMRSTPSVTVYSSATGTSGASYEGGQGDRSVVIENTGESSFGFYVSGPVSNAGNWLRYHWTADAEL